jgi:DNA replication licensing factor MCM4
MSSPINFPDSDVDMQEEESAEQSMSNAPPRLPLFEPATPSTGGTPRKSAVPSTPGIMARRALGMSTPKSAPRTPLFEGKALNNFHCTQNLILC